MSTRVPRKTLHVVAVVTLVLRRGPSGGVPDDYLAVDGAGSDVGRVRRPCERVDVGGVPTATGADG